MDQKVVDRLFDRLKEIFPKWREIWQSDGEVKAAKRQWTRSLVKNQCADVQMIQLGLEAARETGWVRPPSSGQFVKWCIESAKEKAGIPSKENTVSQIMAVAKKSDYARKRTKLCPAVYQTFRFIDWYEFRKLPADKAAKAAEKAYDQMVEHWRQGREFAEQPLMIEDNPSGVVRQRATKEQAKEVIGGLIKELKK